MTVWTLLNSLAIAILGGITFLMVRQVGFILARSGPVGARSTDQGPRIGENLGSFFPHVLTNPHKAKLLIFMSDQCAVCKVVRDGTTALAAHWNRDAEIFVIYDADSEAQNSQLEVLSTGLHIKRAFGLRQRLGANFVPFAVVTGPSGLVVGKGLVNEISHLESLLELEQSKRRRADEVETSHAESERVHPIHSHK